MIQAGVLLGIIRLVQFTFSVVVQTVLTEDL